MLSTLCVSPLSLFAFCPLHPPVLRARRDRNAQSVFLPMGTRQINPTHMLLRLLRATKPVQPATRFSARPPVSGRSSNSTTPSRPHTLLARSRILASSGLFLVLGLGTCDGQPITFHRRDQPIAAEIAPAIRSEPAFSGAADRHAYRCVVCIFERLRSL